MRKILLPLNIGDNYKKLIKYGIQLSDQLKLDLQLLQVVSFTDDPMPMATAYGAIPEQIPQMQLDERKKEAEQLLESSAKTLIEELKPEINVETSTYVGFFVDVVLEKAKTDDVEFILVPRDTSKGFFADLVLSKNTRIIEQARKPVLAINENTAFRPLRHLLYVTHLKREDINYMKKLCKMLQLQAPQISVLCICEEDSVEAELEAKGFEKMLKSSLNYDNITYHRMAGKETQLVSEFSKKAKVDLIVTLKEDNNFFERLFQGDDALDIVQQTKVPVMIFHE